MRKRMGGEEMRMRARKIEKCGGEETTARMCLFFQASLVLLVGFGGEG